MPATMRAIAIMAGALGVPLTGHLEVGHVGTTTGLTPEAEKSAPEVTMTWDEHIQFLADQLLCGKQLSSTIPSDERKAAEALAKLHDPWETKEFPENRKGKVACVDGAVRRR
jgi:hypothetical protein